MTVKDRSTCSTAGITWLPKCVLLTLMWHLFWQVNVIFLVVTMYKMVKHSTSMKPDSSRIGGIRWGRRGGVTLVDKEAELWLLAVRVCVCVCWAGGVGRKIICTITAFAYLLKFQKQLLTYTFIWFSPLLNPTRPVIFPLDFISVRRWCLFSSFYDFCICSTLGYIAFFFFFFISS